MLMFEIKLLFALIEKDEGFRDLAATDVFILTRDEFSIFGKLKLNE